MSFKHSIFIALGLLVAIALPATAGLDSSGLVRGHFFVQDDLNCKSYPSTKYEVGLRIEPSNQYDLVGTIAANTATWLIGSTEYNGVRYANVMVPETLGSRETFYAGWVPYSSLEAGRVSCR